MTRIRSCLSFSLLLPFLAIGEETTGKNESSALPKLSGQSVVFIHPDGAGLSGWNIFRIKDYGPDGHSHWDLLPQTGIYRSHMRDNLDASSNGGGTIHAYGVKVLRDSYGMNGKERIVSASGYPGSVMMEAREAGMTVGIVNSGHLAEPGTACMLASVERRSQKEKIASQLIESGAHLIFGGGEVLFLPKGKNGVHGSPGIRADGRDLIAEAKEAGYTVIYHTSQLENLSSDHSKILGLFAAEDTYNADTEERLEAAGRPLYAPNAPTVGQMTEAALKWCRWQNRPFFLMVEEEGTDNFANAMNAPGTLEAFRRTDAAIGVTRRQIAAFRDLTLLVASDSEAGCPEIIPFGILNSMEKGKKIQRLRGTTAAGAALDGIGGTGTAPFVSAPDQFGQRHLFGIAWTDPGDHYGSVLARAEGSRAKLLPVNLDNTDVYRFLRRVIFAE